MYLILKLNSKDVEVQKLVLKFCESGHTAMEAVEGRPVITDFCESASTYGDFEEIIEFSFKALGSQNLVDVNWVSIKPSCFAKFAGYSN